MIRKYSVEENLIEALEDLNISDTLYYIAYQYKSFRLRPSLRVVREANYLRNLVECRDTTLTEQEKVAVQRRIKLLLNEYLQVSGLIRYLEQGSPILEYLNLES